PDDSRPLRLCVLDSRSHFLFHAGRIWRGSAQHDLKIAVHEFDRVHQMLESFLPRDPSDKKHIWFTWIDTVTVERSSRIDLAILVQIDSIVNHMHLAGSTSNKRSM